MGIFTTLAKHGVAVVAGFLLGLLAIAVIAPETTNGKILLLLTVMCIAVVVGEAVMAVRRMTGRGKGGGSGGDA